MSTQKTTFTLDATLPEYPSFQEGIRRAPDRGYSLTKEQTKVALRNALRYVPKELHAKLAPEFLEELKTRGKIYAYRFRPEGDLKATTIEDYKGKCLAGKAFQVMIHNNLSFDVALYPYELVTYGETGQVCQNWLQYRLIIKYLEELEEDQTLVLLSYSYQLYDGRPIRQHRRLGSSCSNGGSQLWSNDSRRMDVYRSSRHSTWYI